MEMDIKALERAYFYFDDPVPYYLKHGEIKIRPVSLRKSEIFMASIGIFSIDKNALPDAQIISMSYLEFLMKVVLVDEVSVAKFLNILNLCLDIHAPTFRFNERGKPILCDTERDIQITAKEFEDVRRIILYQNISHFDDSYISPDLKEAMEAEDKLRNKNHKTPNLERRMAIITAHCGLSKKEQQEMTFRAHNQLFSEVCGEVDFMTVRPIAIYGGKADKMEHWIFASEKDKLDGYITDESTLRQQLGGSNKYVGDAATSRGDNFDALYNNFSN